MDFGTLRTGVKIAEQTINKGSAKLSNVARNKIINREKLIQAQTKIDMGLKRKTQSQKKVDGANSKKWRQQIISFVHLSQFDKQNSGILIMYISSCQISF